MRSIAGAILIFSATYAYFAAASRGGGMLLALVESVAGIALILNDLASAKITAWLKVRWQRTLEKPWAVAVIRIAQQITAFAGRSYLVSGTLLGAFFGFLAGQWAFGPDPTAPLTAGAGAALGLLSGVAFDIVSKLRANAAAARSQAPRVPVSDGSPGWDDVVAR